MKKAYFYLFYKLYKFSEAAPSRWLSDWKAELAVDVLAMFIVASTIYYFDFNLGTNGGIYTLFYFLLIAFPNYLIFHHNDQWKNIIHDFDKLPKVKNKVGSFIVV